MGRLPFDPDRMKSKADAAKPAGPGSNRAGTDEPMSISALAARIERAVGDAFPARVTVRGEVSGTRQRTHFYFSLKDEDAVIGAVMFASAARRAEAVPRDGRLVVASGRLEYYKPQGRLSLIVDRLTEDGAGSLDARFRALCDELRGLGWFDESSKRPPPVFPRRIAVLTSSSSAALQDVLDTTRRRCPAVELVLVDVTVQGERAAAGLARTVRAVSDAADRLAIDAVLLTRGGGSIEDLWCFNDRGLAEAVRACRVPVVAAIGHESDTTIVELVADRRAATPTQAAMLLTPDREALARQIDALETRSRRALSSGLDAERRRLDALARRPVLADPRRILSIQADRLAGLGRSLRVAQRTLFSASHRRLARLELALERHRPATEHARRLARAEALGDRLRDAVRHAMIHRTDRLDRLEAVCQAIGPAAVLRRGYTITTTPDGVVLRSALDTHPGARLTTRFHDGSVDSTVDGGAGTATSRARRNREKPAAEPQTGSNTKPGASPDPDDPRDEPPQMDLFGEPE